MEGGVTTNGLHATDSVSANGVAEEDAVKPPPANYDPMTMSGLFTRELDLQGEDTETASTPNTATSSSASNLPSGDAFGSCGMTDSFIQQDDLGPPGDELQQQQQLDEGDALGVCGMTDSFMQLTNGGMMTGPEATATTTTTTTAPEPDAVLIDFGQPAQSAPPITATTTTIASSSSPSDALDNGLDSQAAMFGEDFGNSQDGLNRGFGDGSEGKEVVDEHLYHDDHHDEHRHRDDDDGATTDGYHPGQPGSTNPFDIEEPHAHPPGPAGIDLLIQSAPPPPHPFPEEEREPGYNPFEAPGVEPGPPADLSDNNPFGQPDTLEPTRSDELLGSGGGGGMGAGGEGEGPREEVEGEAHAQADSAAAFSSGEGRMKEAEEVAVSYTHLTLPTMAVV